MQGAEAWLEVRQERRLDFLAWGHVGNIAARRHGWCGIPRQWGAGVTRDGAGRPTQARLAVADAAPVEAGALPVELLCGLWERKLSVLGVLACPALTPEAQS